MFVTLIGYNFKICIVVVFVFFTQRLGHYITLVVVMVSLHFVINVILFIAVKLRTKEKSIRTANTF
jgi:hypothetical protein